MDATEQLQNDIVIKGAREHNLRNIDLTIPRNRLVVITGPSGSGKSSLAFDTIYAEGQRRYVESLSSYARQFLDALQKPDVDSIEGLSPAIAIEQKTTSRSRRSTLGTITEIHDYMRVLFTRVGQAFCPDCGGPITSQGVRQLHDRVLGLPAGSRIQILAPVVRGRKGEYRKELETARRDGFIRARIDGRMVDLTDEIRLDRRRRHTIEIVIDRLIMKNGVARRLSDALDLSLRYADLVVVNLVDEGRDLLFSKALACPSCGFSYPELTPRLFSFNSPYGACPGCRGLGTLTAETAGAEPEPCPSCRGARLRREARSVRVGGRSIDAIAAMTVGQAADFFGALPLSDREAGIAARILTEIRDRLAFLEMVGVGYLTLDRSAPTLSGGEGQRIRLATQIGSSLTGVLYILDEPTIGLHPRDCGRLLDALERLRNGYNTVLVVEHDEDTIRRADHVVDMGPGAGRGGGRVVCTGTVSDLEACPASPTGLFLRGAERIPVPPRRRRGEGLLRIRGAAAHNLKGIDVDIPLGVLVCVTGVSGSGKSSLVFDVLLRGLRRELDRIDGARGPWRRVTSDGRIRRVVHVDQRPLGRSPRSNPATYTGIYGLIRTLFSRLPDARVRGFAPGRFSFNVAGGRCEHCRGDGAIKVEMHYLPDVFVTCEACRGSRFNAETLEVRYRGASIADVMNMTVSEAGEFFVHHEGLRRRLILLEDVGLGYIRLGQSATTLSGGEAQRVKLARELARRQGTGTLYVLDEPTTGLHLADVRRLLQVLQALVDHGASVLVIEHHLDVIKTADHVIDLGPGGGERGGRVVAAGTPERILNDPASLTGRHLARVLPGRSAQAGSAGAS